jgi:hypothetical protein
MIWDTKGLSIRPRCIGAVKEAPNPIQSIYLSKPIFVNAEYWLVSLPLYTYTHTFFSFSFLFCRYVTLCTKFRQSVRLPARPFTHPSVCLSVKYFSLSCLRYYQRPNISFRKNMHPGNRKLVSLRVGGAIY